MSRCFYIPAHELAKGMDIFTSVSRRPSIVRSAESATLPTTVRFDPRVLIGLA